MTRRRRRLLSGSALLALCGVLALPGVHWRHVGWVKGEPFYRGRPASYWAVELCRTRIVFAGTSTPEGLLFYQPSDFWRPFKRPLGMAVASREVEATELPFSDGDPTSLPLLVSLASHPEPKVRFFAVRALLKLRHAAGSALPALRALADDKAKVVEDFKGGLEDWLTVGLFAQSAMLFIDPDAPKEAADRP
jgi:HEAT repeats